MMLLIIDPTAPMGHNYIIKHVFTVAALTSSRCVFLYSSKMHFFFPVGQPLSAEWPDMLIIGCFHRPPLRLMRLHHQLLGLLQSSECC